MGKSTISMVIFNSYVTNYQRVFFDILRVEVFEFLLDTSIVKSLLEMTQTPREGVAQTRANASTAQEEWAGPASGAQGPGMCVFLGHSSLEVSTCLKHSWSCAGLVKLAWHAIGTSNPFEIPKIDKEWPYQGLSTHVWGDRDPLVSGDLGFLMTMSIGQYRYQWLIWRLGNPCHRTAVLSGWNFPLTTKPQKGAMAPLVSSFCFFLSNIQTPSAQQLRFPWGATRTQQTSAGGKGRFAKGCARVVGVHVHQKWLSSWGCCHLLPFSSCLLESCHENSDSNRNETCKIRASEDTTFILFNAFGMITEICWFGQGDASPASPHPCPPQPGLARHGSTGWSFF